MPAKAGIHIHRLVCMDTGLRRYDIKADLRFVLILRGTSPLPARARGVV